MSIINRAFALLLAVAFIAASCGSSSDDAASTSPTSADQTEDEVTTSTQATDGAAAAGVDVGLFFDGALAEEVTTEDCALNRSPQRS